MSGPQVPPLCASGKRSGHARLSVSRQVVHSSADPMSFAGHERKAAQRGWSVHETRPSAGVSLRSQAGRPMFLRLSSTKTLSWLHVTDLRLGERPRAATLVTRTSGTKSPDATGNSLTNCPVTDQAWSEDPPRRLNGRKELPSDCSRCPLCRSRPWLADRHLRSVRKAYREHQRRIGRVR